MHLLDANAWCNDCGWKTSGKNSMGNASRHYQRTSHYVHVELHYTQGHIIKEMATIQLQPIQGKLE